MELRQLEYFVAVLEERGFTRAAERVHVAQPGISAQVRRLERELGEVLVDRTGRAVRPTAAGEAVLPYARAALAAVEGARRAVDELTGLVRGRVAIGTVVGGGAIGLPALLAAFHTDHAAVEFSLVEATSDELLHGVREGRLDLALAGLAGEPPPGLGVQVVSDEELVAVVAPDDPWTEPVPLYALADRPLIALPPGTGVRGALDAALSTAGLRPRIAFEAGDVGVLADLARLGLGVAVLPESISRVGLRVLPLVPELRSRLVLVWRADGAVSPAARALIAHLRSATAPPSPSAGGRRA